MFNRKPSQTIVLTGTAVILALGLGLYLLSRDRAGGSSSSVTISPALPGDGSKSPAGIFATQERGDAFKPGAIQSPETRDSRSSDTDGTAPALSDTDSARSRLPAGALIPSEATADLKDAPAPVAEAAPGCFTIIYTHKSSKGHEDADACSTHRNRIKLAVEGVNRSAVCVRVDGTPVKFEWMKDSILIGAQAGPKSRISVRYCLGKDTCDEDCSLPKDEFMAALGGDEERIAKNAAKGGKTAKWDPSDAQDDSDVSAQVDAEMQKELEGGIDLALYDGWIESAPTPFAACKAARAGGKLVSARK